MFLTDVLLMFGLRLFLSSTINYYTGYIQMLQKNIKSLQGFILF